MTCLVAFISGSQGSSYQSHHHPHSFGSDKQFCLWRSNSVNRRKFFEDVGFRLFGHGTLSFGPSNGRQDGLFQGRKNYRSSDFDRAKIDRHASDCQRSCQVSVDRNVSKTIKILN